MNTKSLELELAIEAARKAGDIIRNGYGKVQSGEVKEGKGIVTEVDKAAEKVIIEILSKSLHPILAEESGLTGQKADTYWIVDPLDGTANFSRNYPSFACAIALIKDNNVQIGVVNNPVLHELYYAESDFGSFCNDKKLDVKNYTNAQQKMICIEHGYGERDTLFKSIATLTNDDYYIRKPGATAYELCLLARGTFDVFAGYGDEFWDYAAGLCIAREAGCKVTDWKGKTWDNSSSYILLSNGPLHNEFVNKLGNLQNDLSVI